MYDWHEVIHLSPEQLAENKITEIAVADKKVALLKKQDTIFAFAATCPHAGAPLCEGWLDAQGRIICPLHKYRFDPANGRNTSGEGYKLKTYPVEIRSGVIFIGLLQQTIL